MAVLVVVVVAVFSCLVFVVVAVAAAVFSCLVFVVVLAAVAAVAPPYRCSSHEGSDHGHFTEARLAAATATTTATTTAATATATATTATATTTTTVGSLTRLFALLCGLKRVVLPDSATVSKVVVRAWVGGDGVRNSYRIVVIRPIVA